VVNPDEYVQKMGADTVRCYLMFIGPWDAGGPWNTQGISGVHKFLNRVWTLATDLTPKPPLPSLGEGAGNKCASRGEGQPSSVVRGPSSEDARLRRALHQTIRDVTDDMDKFRFNTMLAKLMSLSNLMQDLQASASGEAWSEAVRALLLMLAPSAPHIAEELWTVELGLPYSIHAQAWPKWDPGLAAEDELTVAVTVNGKPRGTLKVPVSMREDESHVKALALELPRVKALMNGQSVRRVVYVPGRVLNLVVG
ncbi:MAG TPA: class I tRNA ligase family protein, partial [Chloroflexota bacterium]|nr:class I tRNA ligase family protein [Chloroflexota bacterium]